MLKIKPHLWFSKVKLSTKLSNWVLKYIGLFKMHSQITNKMMVICHWVKY